jgi:homoserine kinase
MVDLVAEPTRALLIPGFEDSREVARAAGALAFSIAGSGPSVFAWVASPAAASRVAEGVRQVFGRHGLAADSWVAPIASHGAVVEPPAR